MRAAEVPTPMVVRMATQAAAAERMAAMEERTPTVAVNTQAVEVAPVEVKGAAH